MMKHYPLIALLFLTCILCACSKNKSGEQKKTAAEIAAEIAAYNNSITPGVGLLQYEEKLIPNANSQLVFKLVYESDTVGAYGKINGQGQLQYLNAIVLAKKGGHEILVTELFPDVSKSRMYAIIEGKKSAFVIELNHLSHTMQSLSFLNFNWETGEYTVLKQTYFENDNPIGDYYALRLTQEGGDRVYNCLEPQPTDDIDKAVDNYLNYFQCGLALDSYPMAKYLGEALIKVKEDVEKAEQTPNINQEEIKSIEVNYDKLNNIFVANDKKISKLQSEHSKLTGLLKYLEEKINELLTKQIQVNLVPFLPGTDLDYDEVEDNHIQQVFTIVEKSTNLPYTKQPVFVTMEYIDPATGKILFKESVASLLNNGLVIFRFDPTTLPNYKNYTSLNARYYFTKDGDEESHTRTISLRFINPKLVMSDWSAVPSPLHFDLNEWKLFKVLNEDNREIVQNYNQITIVGNTNPAVNITITRNPTNFVLQLNSTNTTEDQSTSFDVLYKGEKLQTVNAVVAAEKFKLEYISGSGQTYGGGGMPFPLVYQVKKISDNQYVSNLVQHKLSLSITGPIGYQDSPFNNLIDDLNNSPYYFSGYYYLPPNNTGAPYTITLTVSLKRNGVLLDEHNVTQNIKCITQDCSILK